MEHPPHAELHAAGTDPIAEIGTALPTTGRRPTVRGGTEEALSLAIQPGVQAGG